MTASSIGPTYYADFSGLEGLKKSARVDSPTAIREVARQFESLFTNMLLKSMREAKLGDGLGDSQETDFYQGMADQQLALQLSQGKGLGLADMLVRQLTHGNALGNTTEPASGSAAANGAAGSGSTPVGGAPAAAVPDAERQHFIRGIEPMATRVATQLGVATDTVIAQAALETGWGRHLPANAAGGSAFNYFGVKAGASWDGASALANTTEYQQGAPARLQQAFRSYDSAQQGAGDYVALLQGSSRYQQALGTGDDASAFARALVEGGYATDPDYVPKLTATAASVRALRAVPDGGASKPAATLSTTPRGGSV